jgi:CheY-like chemotaxis protein
VSDPAIPPQILHVDDEPDVLEQVRDYLEGEEIEGWGRPKVTGIPAFGDALAELEARRFDLMILDVRLGLQTDEEVAPEEEEGVRTLAAIRERRFLPVVFWTALPAKVEHLAGPVVRVLEKTSGLDNLMESVRQLFATGLPRVNRALRHLVEDEQRRYMWEFVVEHWEELEAGGDHLGVAYLLAKRLGQSLPGPGIRRLAVELGHAGEEADRPEGTIHPAEMYIVPPIAGSGPGVADLVCENVGTDSEVWWLIITPSCDLENGKAEGVILARCVPLAEHPDVRALAERNNSDNRGKVGALLRQATDGQRDRYFFLPAAPAIPALVADFQVLRSLPRDEFDAMKRVATMVSPFAEAVVSRFVRYFGRVGTANLPASDLLDSLIATLGEASSRSEGK